METQLIKILLNQTDAFASSKSQINRPQQQSREKIHSGIIFNLLNKEATYVYKSLFVANLFRLALQDDLDMKGKSLHEYLKWRCSNILRMDDQSIDKVLACVLAMPSQGEFREAIAKVIGKDSMKIMLGREKDFNLEEVSETMKKMKSQERTLVSFCKQILGGTRNGRKVIGIAPNCNDLIELIETLAEGKVLKGRDSLKGSVIDSIRKLTKENSSIIEEHILPGIPMEKVSEISNVKTRSMVKTKTASQASSSNDNDAASQASVWQPTVGEMFCSLEIDRVHGKRKVTRNKRSHEQQEKRRKKHFSTQEARFDFDLDQRLEEFALHQDDIDVPTDENTATNGVGVYAGFSVDESSSMKAKIQKYIESHPDAKEKDPSSFNQVMTRNATFRPLNEVNFLAYDNDFTQKYFCVEEYFDDNWNSDLKEPLPKKELKLIKRFLTVKLPNKSFYIAKSLKKHYHFLANKADVQTFLQRAEDYDIDVTRLSTRKHHDISHDPIIRIMAEGNKNYDKFFSNVRLDVQEIVERMLHMAKNGALAKDPERGTLAINIGFGSRNFSKFGESQVYHSPDFIETGLKFKNGVIYDPVYFYKCLQDLLPKVNQATLFHGIFGGVSLFPDARRRSLFGQRLSKICGCDDKRNDFEAVTFSLTNCHNDGQNCSLERHKDTLDDERVGYDITSVFSLDGIAVDGGRYRLSIIFYLRNQIGCFMDKEYGSAANAHALQIVQQYQKESTLNQKSYDEFILDPNERKYLEVAQGKNARFCGIKVPLTFVERDGYHSTIAYPILQMRRAYKLTRKQVTELIYIGMLTGDAVKFSYILIESFLLDKGDDNSHLSPKSGVSFDAGDSMTWRYIEGAGHLELSCSGGMNARNQPLAGKFFTRFNESKIHEHNKLMTKLDENIKTAESDTNFERIVDRLKEVAYIKDFSVIGLLAVAAMVGLLNSQQGYENATKARLNPKGAYFEKLRELGCNSIEKEQKLLKYVSERLQITHATVESALCEGMRDHAKSDAFYYCQFIMKLDRNENGDWVVYKKVPRSSKWEVMSFTEYSFGDIEV